MCGVYTNVYKCIYQMNANTKIMPPDCPIRIKCSTKESLRELSLIHGADGRPTEPYDSIIRRAIITLKAQQQPKHIDVSRI